VTARTLRARADWAGKIVLDRVLALVLLILFAPVIVALAAAVRLESPGPAFYRSRRIGFQGREFSMLKFRKMRDGATGLPLTAPDDERFTRMGSLLARLKLDELPQLWNVLKGEMSLVGPRPEDPAFVEEHPAANEAILQVKPGITGLCQLAFAREPEILNVADPVDDYVQRLLPEKARLDDLYARRRSLSMDLRILAWTAVVVLLRREVAVNRQTARLTVRRRPSPQAALAAMDPGQAA
jgi:lipopolysaccharide/colanic/teichoic acid biosynthesis glycosyltransferase